MKRLRDLLLTAALVVFVLVAVPVTLAGHVALQAWLFNKVGDLHAWARLGFLQHLVAAGACAAIVPVALFLRWNQRGFYGAIEISGALAVVWLVLGADLAPASTFGAIVGSIYVMVRGVDNVRGGMAEREQKNAAARAAKNPAAAPQPSSELPSKD